MGNGQKCNIGNGTLMGMERKCDMQYGRIVTGCILIFAIALEVKQLLKGKKGVGTRMCCIYRLPYSL